MNAQLQSNVHVPGETIAAFCRRNGVRRLAFFGSVLRGDFRSDSDVDVLVEFEPGRSVGYLSMATMEIELGGLLGRRADLRTPAELSRHFRDDVLRESEVGYAA
jgi:predicted nucleotidyltransferase